jgi:arginine N-succinyltransferase
MLVVRPALPADYESLMSLAVLSGAGFTSLPEHEPTLRDRLDVSAASFSGALEPQERWYTLMLEDTETGEVAGVAGVAASVGRKRPFFSFRVVTFAQASPVMKMRFDHQAQVLVNECAGWSEVGSLFLKAERRKGGAGHLLAQSRYMLIAAAPELFSDQVLAELRGFFAEDGASPFWNHVGQRFFHMPFDQADRMSSSTDGQFILDLAPRHPIYVEAARDAIGRVHRDGEPARALLEREGFRPNGLVDIFDAGPTVVCPRDDIHTVRESLTLRTRIGDDQAGEPALISVDDLHRFRATRAVAVIDDEVAVISAETARALQVNNDDLLRVKL